MTTSPAEASLRAGGEARFRSACVSSRFSTPTAVCLRHVVLLQAPHVNALESKDDEAVRCFRREIGFLDRLDHALAQRILVGLHTRLGADDDVHPLPRGQRLRPQGAEGRGGFSPGDRLMLSCPSCGKRISDRAPACPFCKAAANPAPPAASPPAPPTPPAVSFPAPPEAPAVSVPAAPTVPAARVPFPPTDDPTATLPPSPALFFRSAPAAPPPPVPTPVQAAQVPPPEEPPPPPKPDADSVALEAAEHFNAERFEDALTTIDRLLRTQPRNGEALNWRAQALFKLGRREEAARAIVKAIEASPDSLPFWLNKAVMEQEEGKAKQAFRSALDLVEIAQHNETESPLVDQGRQMIAAFEGTGAFPNARGYLGWLGLGCVSMKAGRAEAALDFFDRAIDAASGNADGFRWKGRALTQLGQMDEALILFETALEIAPNDPEIHHDRGIAFAMLGDSDRAVEAFDAALALDPHHAPSLLEKRKYAG